MTKLLEQTLHSLERLPTEELDALVTHALKLRASRHVPHLSHEETLMLEKIHQAIPTEVVLKYAELLDKRDMQSLSEPERGELFGLTNAIENLEAQRVVLLGELARLRGVRLDQVMQDLGLTAPMLRDTARLQ